MAVIVLEANLHAAFVCSHANVAEIDGNLSIVSQAKARIIEGVPNEELIAQLNELAGRSA